MLFMALNNHFLVARKERKEVITWILSHFLNWKATFCIQLSLFKHLSLHTSFHPSGDENGRKAIFRNKIHCTTTGLPTWVILPENREIFCLGKVNWHRQHYREFKNLAGYSQDYKWEFKWKLQIHTSWNTG